MEEYEEKRKAELAQVEQELQELKQRQIERRREREQVKIYLNASKQPHFQEEAAFAEQRRKDDQR